MQFGGKRKKKAYGGVKSGGGESRYFTSILPRCQCHPGRSRALLYGRDIAADSLGFV